jgi:hypothetical protein
VAVPSSPPVLPVPTVDVGWDLAGAPVDLSTRALVVGLVRPPRFGREGEVVAAAVSLAAAGADVVDVSLPGRLVGPVASRAARGEGPPAAVRARSMAEVAAAKSAGAQVVLVPVEFAAGAAGAGDDDRTEQQPTQQPMELRTAVLVAVDDDGLAGLPAALDAATARGWPLAVDVGGWSGPAAVARETAAIAGGCRLVVTADPRRTRRVVEVMAAVLGARQRSRS